MKRFAALITLLCISTLSAAEPARLLDETPKNILFIGNSFTGGTWGTSTHLADFALAAPEPETLNVDEHIDGGKTLQYHWNLGVAPDRIREGGWDVVVLQEFDRDALAYGILDTFLHYSALFDALIDSVGAQTVFFMTHENPGNHHVIEQIQAANDSAGVLFDAVVVPCGLVHELVKDEHPYLDPLHDPYDTDDTHASIVGDYLNYCTFLTAFTRKSQVGNTYDPGQIYYSAADLLYLQSASWDLMRDYIETPCADSTTAPSVPAGLAGEARSYSSVGLTWDEATHAACGIRKYNVYRDGDYAGSAYQPVFVDTSLLGGTQYDYTVTVLSLGGVESAESSPVSVTTIADTILPELVDVPVTKRATQVVLVFSEDLDSASAETPGNYAVDNGIIVSAAVLSNGTQVSLTVSALAESVTYTVTVTGVTDNSTSKNAVAPGTQGTFEYIPPVMMDHCIGYFPFEMSLEDYSSSGLTATWKRDPSFTDGYDRYGVWCDGSEENSYPVIARNEVFRSQDAFTYALWFRKAEADEHGWLMHMNAGFDLRVYDTGFLGGITTTDTTLTWDFTASAVNNTDWHHLVMTYDGSTVKIYVDASVVHTEAVTGTRDTYSSLALGNHTYVAGGIRSFHGTLDEFRMYDIALDSVGIAALYTDNTGLVADADSAAVQELINQNMLLTSVGVVATKDVSSGRVLACDFDSTGIYRIVEEVGQLTAMRALYCAGDSTADSLLTIVDGAIGNCTALETLVLKDNILTSLPDEIAGLTNIAYLDVSGNRLCNVSDPVKTWLDTYDPDWADSQDCTTDILRVPERPVLINLEEGMLVDNRGRTVSRARAASGIYLRYDAVTGQLVKTVIIK